MTSPKTSRPYQFSLKAMLLAAVCCGVAAKLCVWQHGLLAEEMSTGVLVFLDCWNVTIVAQVACVSWGWVWLSRSRELAAYSIAGHPDNDDLQVREQKERRRAYLGSVAWGALSLASWLTFVVTWLCKDHTDDVFVALFCFAFWHLMPLTIASYVRFASRSQWKRTRSLAAIRIAAFVGLVLPALAFTLHWLQS